MCPEESPVDPNQLPLNNLIAAARSPLHEIVGVPPALLTPDECENLRPDVDRVVARDWAQPLCLRKAHDAYTFLPDGRPLMGGRPDFAAIYILRNPWDVAVSAANHWGQTIEQAVNMMCEENTAIESRKDRSSPQIHQRLLSWSGHVASWLKAPLDLCVLRYEDMHSRPLETFQRAVRFLGVQASDSDIQSAMEASRFDRLQGIERERGFLEAAKNRRFFRSGRTGEGRQLLSEQDQRRLDKQFEEIEKLLGQKGQGQGPAQS